MDQLEAQIEDAYQRQLTKLRLVTSFSVDLPPSIGKLTQLQELHLKGCNIRSLPREIGQLRALRVLDLSYNQLTGLPETLGQLRQLVKLDLSNNFLSRLPTSFGQLTQLRELNLAQNQFYSLPMTLGQLIQLEHLDVAGNTINAWPFQMHHFRKLNFLNIQVSSKGQLPIHFTQFDHLKELRIKGSWITGLPETFYWLKRLKVLELNMPHLEQIPDGLGRIPHLEKLIITNAAISKLPKSFFRLSKLRNLDLTNNRLLRIPEEISHLKELRILKLSGNRIPKVPDSIVSCTDLFYLDLFDNPLATFPKPVCFLPRLEHLRLPAAVYRPVPEAVALLDHKVRLLIPSEIKNIEPAYEIQRARNYLRETEAHRNLQKMVYRLMAFPSTNLTFHIPTSYLLQILNFKRCRYLRRKALDSLSARYQQGTWKITKGARIALIGDFLHSKKELKALLEQIGAILEKDPEQARFILLGERPNLEFSRSKDRLLHYLTERDLCLHVNATKQQHGPNDPEFETSVRNLGTLIKHADLDNHRLGMELLKASGLQQYLLEDLILKLLKYEWDEQAIGQEFPDDEYDELVRQIFLYGTAELFLLARRHADFDQQFLKPLREAPYVLTYDEKPGGVDLQRVVWELVSLKRNNS